MIFSLCWFIPKSIMTRKIKAIIVGLKKQFYKIRQLNKHDKAHECKKIHVLFCNHADYY